MLISTGVLGVNNPLFPSSKLCVFHCFAVRYKASHQLQGSKLTFLLRRQLATKGKNLVARS